MIPFPQMEELNHEAATHRHRMFKKLLHALEQGENHRTKPPLKPQEIWSIRVLLKMKKRYRDLALFNLAIDSKLRACDLVKLRTSDVVHGESILARASILQQKTGQPVRFEITEQNRVAVQQWMTAAKLQGDAWLFASRARPEAHISTRQYAGVEVDDALEMAEHTEI